jgi:hypothetical protein
MARKKKFLTPTEVSQMLHAPIDAAAEQLARYVERVRAEFGDAAARKAKRIADKTLADLRDEADRRMELLRKNSKLRHELN